MSKNTVIIPENESMQESTVVISRKEAARQQTFRNIGLIVGREYKNRMTQRAFIISTAIIAILLLIGTCVPTVIQYFSSRSSSQVKVTIINNAGTIGTLDSIALTQYITTSLNGNSSQAGTQNQGHFVVSTDTANTTASLQNAVKNSKLDTLLILDRSADKNLHFTAYTNVSATDSSSNSDLLQVQNLAKQLNVLDQSTRLGLTPAQTQSLFAQPAYQLISTQQDPNQRSAGEQVASYFLAYIGVILIFMAIFMYGIGVATGVAEEKGTRIMEILVNAATPFQLMAGKILGIGAAGLTQMALFVLVGIAGFLAQPVLKTLLGIPTGGAAINFDITGTSITMLLLVLLYFILGFLLYSTLFAAVGALVKRQDEVQSAAQPLTWLFMIGYFASFAGATTPNALWMRIISYVPFWTPTTMLTRIGTGMVAPWEIGLTIVLMVIAIFICAIISSRIYRSGILMYGQKPTLRQLIRLARLK